MTPQEIANKWQMNRYRTPGQEGGMDNHEFYHLLSDDISQLLETQSCLFTEWIDDRSYNNVLSRVRARSSDYYNQWVYHPTGQKEATYHTTSELYQLYKQTTKP